MCPSNAGLFGTWTNRSLLGEAMRWRDAAAINIIRKFALPIIIGAVVTWLFANNYSDFAKALCNLSNGFGIGVKECLGK